MSNKSLARKNRHRFRTMRSTVKTFVLNVSLSHPNGNSRLYGEIPHPQCIGYGVSDEGAEPEELDIAAGLDAALGRRDVTITPMWCDKNGGIIAWNINK